MKFEKKTLGSLWICMYVCMHVSKRFYLARGVSAFWTHSALVCIYYYYAKTCAIYNFLIKHKEDFHSYKFYWQIKHWN